MNVDFEPFSEIAQRDPYPHYAALREHAPIHWAPGAGAWLVSRHEDVQWVLKHPELFSSSAMGGMLTGRPEVSDATAGVRDRVIILMDPPHHAELRNILNRGFTPRRIADLEARVGRIVEASMSRVRRMEQFDLVEDVSAIIPVTVIAELLGVETERIGDFRRWSNAVIAGVSGSGRNEGGAVPAFMPALTEILSYVERIAERRIDAPTDDLISALVAAEQDEVGLNQHEVALFAIVMLIAGNETTTNLIGSMVRALYRHPDQLEKVLADRSLVPKLVEETLRYEPPIQFVFRKVTRDVEIAGVKIPEGAGVIPLLGSANRDERVFERGDEFDISRDATGHVTFGFGNHYCLGASLARLEAKVIVEALLDELPGLQPQGDPSQNVDSFMMRGPRSLPLARVA